MILKWQLRVGSAVKKKANGWSYPVRVKCETTNGPYPLTHKTVVISDSAQVASIQTVHFDDLARRTTGEKQAI